MCLMIGQFSHLINYSRWEEEYTMRMELEEKVAELEEVKPIKLNIQMK